MNRLTQLKKTIVIVSKQSRVGYTIRNLVGDSNSAGIHISQLTGGAHRVHV